MPPGSGLTKELYCLIGRPDLAAQSYKSKGSTPDSNRSTMEVSVQKSEPCALLKTGIGNVEGAGAGKPGSSLEIDM